MENKEDRIIEEITESLVNYELPYEEGAWERFREKQQVTELVSIPVKEFKEPSFIGVRRLMAVAASLIFLMSIISVYKAYRSDDQLKTTKIERDKSVIREGIVQELSPVIQKEDENEGIKAQSKNKAYDIQIVQRRINAEFKIEDIEEKNVSIITALDAKESVLEEKKSILEEKEQMVETEKGEPDSSKEEIKPISSFGNLGSPILLSENGRNKANDLDNEENWKFGVELSSSFISDKITYSGGVFAERKLSDKIFLASGLGLTKINAANDMEPIGISSSTRRIGVESSMQALDIPLSIVYQVSDGFYASMGVSLLTVLNENKSYQYETDIVSQSFVRDPKTGVELTVYSMVTRQYTEPAKETDHKEINNIGYFNLSIGKKQEFYGKTKLLLEPFLKVPVSKQSDKEVKLMNAGLKIKVMF